MDAKIRTGGEKGENKICLRQQTADNQESKSFSAFRKQIFTRDIGPHDPFFIGSIINVGVTNPVSQHFS